MYFSNRNVSVFQCISIYFARCAAEVNMQIRCVKRQVMKDTTEIWVLFFGLLISDDVILECIASLYDLRLYRHVYSCI